MPRPPTSRPSLWRGHAWLLGALALLLPQVLAAQEVVEYYALDAIGSVRVVFHPDGTVKGRMDYTPFGGQLQPAVALPPEAFAGLFRDPEAGLDHAQARSYQVRTGRFSTIDPIYAGLFDPQKWNRYAYALNSPVTFADPTGEYPCEVCNDGRMTLDWRVGGIGGYPSYGRTSFPGGGSPGTGPGSRAGWRPPDPPQPPPPPPTTTPPEPRPPPPGRPDPIDDVREKVCSLLPEGRVVSGAASVGGLVATGASLDTVINYNTGQVSYHASSGLTAGWNGVASVSLRTGFLYDLGQTNASFSGPSIGGSLEGGIPGSMVNAGAGVSGWRGGAKALTGSVSVSLVGGPPVPNVSVGRTSQPVSAGRINLNTPGSVVDLVFFGARQLVCR
jgi:RHS repeat-associated protein